MEDVWNETRLFRISSDVHMVELMVLQRLHRDGFFPWCLLFNPMQLWVTTQYDRSFCRITQTPEHLRLCFIMRRTPEFRSQFAAVVGKRLFSERLVSNTR